MLPKTQDENKIEKMGVEEEIDLGLVESKGIGQIPHETKRGLSSRHIQMIAIGGTIGTGLFVTSGHSLHTGGPLFFLLAYTLLATCVFMILTAIVEFSSYLPVPGSSVANYGNRFVSRSMGFALGWFYYYTFVLAVPTEVTASVVVISYWHPSVNNAVWITILILVIVTLNLFPVNVYGETEFWFASIKVIGIVGLLLMALVITYGGGPNHTSIGFRYWHDPGPMNDYLVGGSTGRFLAFLGALRVSIYVFVFAPELLALTAGEMQNPRRNLPTAGRRYFIRLVTFYVLGALMIGLIVPSNDNRLMGGSKNATSSPWVIGAKNAGIKGLDSVINTLILLSAWSSGNGWMYLSSRSLYSLAKYGMAPKVFTRCTSAGVPYVSLIFTSLFSVFAYMSVNSSATTVFNWFVNLANSSGYISWICTCFIYIRFRKATFAQEVHELPYRSFLQPYGAYAAGSIMLLLLLLNGFEMFFPREWDVSTFLTAYVSIAIFLVLYLGHKFIAARDEPWLIPPRKVDLQSGLQDVIDAEFPPIPAKNIGHKILQVLFE
ncbi:hypothetical protein N7462_008887 [Penicillium macrosclerotiorum]|uniref:uncharacterized protein n=1 Tax=Penicillium macrosclerotiorum TaxID=303699 RepID=UPI002547AE14|nr:uncharacterized protein N7462_008887 [Penicillium macrosclerotiorum]KAJ5675990.1 hypothetical protein N7462_008887 [Penicillium macrosclerotiorum]